jgi:succinyl-CoA synthetase alpha subunit
MAIIVYQTTRLAIQGITGTVGRGFAERMVRQGTRLVAGTTRGKREQDIFGVPVYSSVEEAVLDKKADCSLIVVPARFAKDAILEALDAGIKTVIVYTEGLPVHDSVYVIQYARLKKARIIGPNSAGVLSPGKCNVSDINDELVKAGDIGIVSRSGTLTYEVMDRISQYDLGVSTVCCLGGDLVVGTRYLEVLKLFERDDETKAVVLLGEIGGTDEVEAAKYIKSMNKPVFSYVAGLSVPLGKRMGHAGAIISGEKDRASYKKDALAKAGAFTAETLRELIGTISSYYDL